MTTLVEVLEEKKTKQKKKKKKKNKKKKKRKMPKPQNTKNKNKKSKTKQKKPQQRQTNLLPGRGSHAVKMLLKRENDNKNLTLIWSTFFFFFSFPFLIWKEICGSHGSQITFEQRQRQHASTWSQEYSPTFPLFFLQPEMKSFTRSYQKFPWKATTTTHIHLVASLRTFFFSSYFDFLARTFPYFYLFYF